MGKDELDADMARFDEHMDNIREPHKAAFRQPARSHYGNGEFVWMYDHYNTAVVRSYNENTDEFLIVTTDADGSMSCYEYKTAWLRPADKEYIFTWNS